MRLPIPEDQISAHCSDLVQVHEFQSVQNVPRNQLNLVIGVFTSPGGLHLQGLTAVGGASLTAVVSTGVERLVLGLVVDNGDRVDQLSITGVPTARPPIPTSWTELDQRLERRAPQVSFLAAEVNPAGSCHSVHAVGADVPRQLASMFKLYVLGALANEVQAGRLSWDQPVTIEDDMKSPLAPATSTPFPPAAKSRCSNLPPS
jgi:hypothetical protein